MNERKRTDGKFKAHCTVLAPRNGQFHLAVERNAGAPREVGGAHPNAGSGRSRKDHHPLQTKAKRDGVQHPDHRLQRGNRDAGKRRHVHRVGRRRPGQDTPALEALFPQHGGPGVRGGQRGQGAH